MPRLPSAAPGRSIPSGACVAAHDDAAAGEMVAASRPANSACPAVSSAEVGSSSSQTGRRTASRRAIDKPPPLAGRQICRRQMRGMAEAHRREALADVAGVRRRENPARTTRFSVHAQRRFQRVAMAEIVGLLRQRQLGLAAFQGDLTCRPAPAAPRSAAAARSCRRRSGRPRPAASPDEASKSRPENTSRPPARYSRFGAPRAAFSLFTAL